jgi:16S rRNA G966 N2-methylase RsmD
MSVDNIKSLTKIFPYLRDRTKIKKLKIDEESLHYISLKDCANSTSMIIIQHLHELGVNHQDAYITDATAGVGGNTISFAMNFKHATGIELDKLRYDYLINNLDVYDIDNVKSIHGDSLKLMSSINKQHVVFIDPPWGGRDYKKYQKLKLSLSDVAIEQICNDLFDENKTKYPPLFIVLKLPTNYDLKYLYETINNDMIYLHKLHKMNIIVITRKQNDSKQIIEDYPQEKLDLE